MIKKSSWYILILIFMMLPVFNAQAGDSVLMMATTSSTDGTGLLDYLKPYFEQETGIELKWTATGTGKALALGQNCDVDVLLVHAPSAEKKYIADGYGKDRREIMYNDFVIIGPENDPAGIKGKTITDALTTIKTKKAAFISRGDDSGTHKKEKSLWLSANIPLPDGEAWYVQGGQKMQATINMAQEKDGYTMADRGSYIKYADNHKGSAPLKILVEGDAVLLNQYAVLTLNPENCPKAKYDLAVRYSDWMASQSTQKLIKDFKLLGQALFTPNAK